VHKATQPPSQPFPIRHTGKGKESMPETVQATPQIKQIQSSCKKHHAYHQPRFGFPYKKTSIHISSFFRKSKPRMSQTCFKHMTILHLHNEEKKRIFASRIPT